MARYPVPDSVQLLFTYIEVNIKIGLPIRLVEDSNVVATEVCCRTKSKKPCGMPKDDKIDVHAPWLYGKGTTSIPRSYLSVLRLYSVTGATQIRYGAYNM